jgi:hypothetical protein
MAGKSVQVAQRAERAVKPVVVGSLLSWQKKS